MQVMIDLQLEEMRISFESNAKQKKNPQVNLKQKNSLVEFYSPCQETIICLRSCDW